MLFRTQHLMAYILFVLLPKLFRQSGTKVSLLRDDNDGEFFDASGGRLVSLSKTV